MKKLYCLILLAIIGCNSESALQKPTNVSRVHVKPDTGAMTIYWNIPDDSNYTYLKISYQKYPDNPDTSDVISTNVSIYTDSLNIDGLLHKYKYTFKIQAFNVNRHNKKRSNKILTTKGVRPIRRPIIIDTSLTQVPLKISYLSSEPVTSSVKYLIDGDLNSIWQTDWVHNTHQPPFYFYINFPNVVSIGAMKYALGAKSNPAGYANQFAISISKNGDNWDQVWKSKSNLPVVGGKLYTLFFDKNYKSKNFRFGVLSTKGGGGFASMGELKVYKMKITKVDEEKKAEENY